MRRSTAGLLTQKHRWLRRVPAALLLLGTMADRGGAAPIAPDALQTAMHHCAAYLRNACLPSGQFVYRINLDPATEPTPSYNILRHAGAVVALADYERRFPNAETRDALKRAVGFMTEHAIAPLPDMPEMQAVWSNPEINLGSAPRQAKLGAAGLALLAHARVERVLPRTASLPTDIALGNFLIFMQREDGSFHAKFWPNQGWSENDWVSLYYPGEAALGLLELHTRDARDGVYLSAATRALLYLTAPARRSNDDAVDHWTLLASARLLEMPELNLPPEQHRQLIDFARSACEEIIAAADRLPNSPELGGSLTADQYTAPTATRIEGLLAALSYLPRSDLLLIERSLRTAENGLRFLINAQVTVGPHRGAIPRWGPYRRLDPAMATMARNNPRIGEVRIDYVQHVLSALLMYEQLTGAAWLQAVEP